MLPDTFIFVFKSDKLLVAGIFVFISGILLVPDMFIHRLLFVAIKLWLPSSCRYPGFGMASQVAERRPPKRRILTDVRQTRELDRFSRTSSFLSGDWAFFAGSPLDAFLIIGTSRPMRISVVFSVLSEPLSSGDVFILFIVWLMLVVD